MKKFSQNLKLRFWGPRGEISLEKVVPGVVCYLEKQLEVCSVDILRKTRSFTC